MDGKMKELFLLDACNYDESLDEIRRNAVRAIIIRNRKLLMIETKVHDEIKLPGGGVLKDESFETALCREVLEETGRHVIIESIKEFGYVEEKRKSIHEEMIWHQFNYYYLAEIDDTIEETSYTENEKKYGFYPIWIDIDEAIKINEEIFKKKGKLAWNQREYLVLNKINEILEV